MLDCRVFDDFTEDTAVTATDYQDGFGVGVGVHGEVGYHFLVAIFFSVSLYSSEVWSWLDLRKFIPLCALNDVVEDEYCAMIARFKHEDVLIFRFLVMEDLVDFESHGLPGPHVGDLTEPAIW